MSTKKITATVPTPGAAGELRLTEVPAAEWREHCAEVLEAGGRFLALYAARGLARGRSGTEGPLVLRALFSAPEGLRLLWTVPVAGEVPSIVELVPAARVDQKEAADAYGLAFEGHSPMRPVLSHPTDLDAWTVPVAGRDAYEVAVGPIHAGVIESGHFRFHVVGESILHVDVRLFYKHRGLERAAEGRTLAEGLEYAQRACGACAVSNGVAYAQAVESLSGLWPEPGLANVRTLLLELERLYNHLNDLSAMCAGVGFATGSMVFAALKERAQRLNAGLFGHRFLFGTVQVGKSDLRVSRQAAADARRALSALREDTQKAWHELFFSRSVQERFTGVGAISLDEAVQLGTVGPAARAAGVARDVRTESPRLAYEGFKMPAFAELATGDVAARANVRAVELEGTFALLDRLLGLAIEPAATVAGPASAVGVGRVESPRGETVCLLEAVDGVVSRLHLRTGSYANWPSLVRAATGAVLVDFPLINKSFELCYACSDR
jgi:Ni,Fe-hydrogenase III large subunit/NADH:ubiquinone oxidoreductase subunit C